MKVASINSILTLVGSSIRDHVVSKIFEDNTQNILDENDPEYQVLYSKFQEAIAK